MAMVADSESRIDKLLNNIEQIYRIYKYEKKINCRELMTGNKILAIELAFQSYLQKAY
tara:strand:+ start:105 stop:278 length:174 start_codon:yes stop_codon:yes gene_type:complete